METPTPTATPAPATPAAPQHQVMDVVAPPTTPGVASDAETAVPASDASDQPAAVAAERAVTRPKTPRDKGVVAAITVTIIVIAALSGLAVFAYTNS